MEIKDAKRKGNYKTISFMNLNAKKKNQQNISKSNPAIQAFPLRSGSRQAHLFSLLLFNVLLTTLGNGKI